MTDNRSGHVFVSYSRTDQQYVDKLVAAFEGRGINYWVDAAVPYGEGWLEEIKRQLDVAAVVVVVMTPAAEKSKWVNRELQRAEDLGRPIHPLLLKGERFFRLADLQDVDVTGGALPPDGWFDELHRGAPDDEESSNRRDAAREKAAREKEARQRRRRAIRWGAAAAAVLVVAVVVGILALAGGDDNSAVEIDVPAAVAWTDTGVDVAVGDSVVVDATGTIHHAKEDPSTAVGPDGASDDELRVPSFNEVGQGVYVNPPGHGGLIGKIGEDAEDVIGVGSHLEIDSSTTAGRLYLGINDYGGGEVDEAVANNDGSYRATITATRD